MIKLALVGSILAALAAGPVNCGSLAGPPDPPPNIAAPSSAQ